MALTAEQIAEARKEGYSDDEILSHYAKVSGADIEAARKGGYSNSEILSHLSGADVSAPESDEEFAAPKDSGMLRNPALSGALGAGAGAVYSAKTVPVKAAKAFGNVVAGRLAQPAPAAPSPTTYTTPSGIPVEQTPGGLHPGAVGNAQFNVEQQQANALRQNMPAGFEQRGTSRIMTPVGMEEPAAALGGKTPGRGGSILSQKRAEGWPIVRETTQAVKAASPVVGKAAQRVATSSPVAGAIAGYNLQQAVNAKNAGDTTGKYIGYTGAGSQLIPSALLGKYKALKPVVGLGSAVVNKLRGEPESVMNKAEGGCVAPHIEHMRKGGSVQHFNGGKRALAEGVIGGAKKGYEAIKGYLPHTPAKPHPEVGTRYTRELVENLIPEKVGKIEDYAGASFVPLSWDNLNANKRIVSVSGHELTEKPVTHGGRPWVRNKKRYEELSGGASDPIISGRVNDRAIEALKENEMLGGSGDVFHVPITMDPMSGMDYSGFPGLIMMDLMKQREFKPSQIKEFDDMIRGYKLPKGDLKGFLGFQHPEMMDQFYSGVGLNAPAGELRKGIANRFGLASGQKALDYNIQDLVNAISDPRLQGLPNGYMGSTLIKAMPDLPLYETGNKIYPTGWGGQYHSSLPIDAPADILMPKAYGRIYSEMESKYGTKSPNTLRAMTLGALGKRKAGISEIVDNQVIDNYNKYLEGIKSGNIKQGDLWGTQQYFAPDNYAEGGEVKHMAGGKLAGGLGMLPMSARTELRKRGQLANRSGIPAALTMPDPAMVSAYNSAPGDLMKLAAMYANPVLGAGMTGGQMMQAASSGDYGDAALLGGLGALGVAGNIPKGVRAVRGVANSMMQNPRAPSMMDRLYNTGAADDHLQAVPAMAGGGDVAKAILRKAMGVGSRTIEGSPHTYPPIAEGPWMRDYVPSTGTGLPTTRQGWDELGAQHQAAQNKVDYSMGRTGPTQPQAIQYMGKYRRGTPEERAIIKAQEQDALRSIVEGRKQQWVQRSREMGMTDQEIADEIAHSMTPPWMP